MARLETLDHFSRVNRRCNALVEIAQNGQLAAQGLELASAFGTNNLSRELMEGGLDFIHLLERELKAFADGEEFRPGLEDCNHAAIMARVFRIRTVSFRRPVEGRRFRSKEIVNRRLVESRANLNLTKQVLSELSNGTFPQRRNLKKAIKFLYKSLILEELAGEATNKALGNFGSFQNLEPTANIKS